MLATVGPIAPVDLPAVYAGAAAAASLTRRVKAVACTAPLHDLEANKVRRGGEAWDALNCWELAFVAIDLVATRMDFDSGAPYDDAIAVVAAQAEHQRPELGDAGYADVGAWIVDGLVNGRAGGSFGAEYGRWTDDGYESSAWSFKLLTEHPDDGGGVYLRASDEAINVLMGALDTDVESAAIAAEAKLANLIERGLLDEAVATAQSARYLSIRYAEALRREVAGTRLNVADVDWAERVPRLIDAALTHVLDRYRAEGRMLANIATSRDEAVDTRLRDRANELIRVLKDCERRHQALHARLLTIRKEFREAQDELLSRPPADVVRVDIERALLVPLLRLPVGAAAEPLRGFFTRLSGPMPLPLGDVGRLLDVLAEPRVRNDHLGEEVEDPDLADLSRVPVFDDAMWDVAEGMLDDVDVPTRLSAVLARTADMAAEDGAVDVARACRLVAFLAARAYDPDLAHSARQDRVLVAVADGTMLETPWLSGDDLLLVPAEVAGRDAGPAHV